MDYLRIVKPSVRFYLLSKCTEGVKGYRFTEALFKKSARNETHTLTQLKTVMQISSVSGFLYLLVCFKYKHV